MKMATGSRHDAMMQRDEQGKLMLSERGMGPDGRPVTSDRRLFIQFLAYGRCRDPMALTSALEGAKMRGALYLDMNDALGIGLAAVSEEPDYFVMALRKMLQGPAFRDLLPKPEYTMFGRTYSVGYENDLDHVLVGRPLGRLTDPGLPWAIWYPLRRRGAFALLPAKEQREILAEHGLIGNAFGEAGYAHDIRLACHGLDRNDNDFVIGVVGKELHPLSALVQTMRGTKQTAQYIERMGPFFVGKAIWRGA